MDFLFRYYDYLLFIIIGLVEHCELLLDRVECVFANVINATLTIYMYCRDNSFLMILFAFGNVARPTDWILIHT